MAMVAAPASVEDGVHAPVDSRARGGDEEARRDTTQWMVAMVSARPSWSGGGPWSKVLGRRRALLARAPHDW